MQDAVNAYRSPLKLPAHVKITVGGGGVVRYQAHVEGIGWQDWVSDGAVAGTTGKSLRMEAIRIVVSGYGVRYQAHVQNIGWQDWVSDGAVAGTTGQSLRMEAIKIDLVRAPAGYHIYYKAHVEGIGWQDWVSDGAVAGTTGKSLRMEAIQIELRKGELYADVKYRGQVHYINPQDYEVIVKEILDPTDKLKKEDFTAVWPSGSGQVIGKIDIGSYVEVYGEFQGVVPGYPGYRINVYKSYHYIKSISPVTINDSGGLQDYKPLEAFPRGLSVYVKIGNVVPKEYSFSFLLWIDKNQNLLVDEGDVWVPHHIPSFSTSKLEFDVEIPKDCPIGLYRLQADVEGRKYQSNNFFVIFNAGGTLPEKDLKTYCKDDVTGRRPPWLLAKETITSHHSQEVMMSMASAALGSIDLPRTERIAVRIFQKWVREHTQAREGASCPSDIREYVAKINATKKPDADCDGLSVFLVALARAAGIPARCINGINWGLSLWNHMWVEAYYGDSWKVWDPAYDLDYNSKYKDYIEYHKKHGGLKSVGLLEIKDEVCIDRGENYGVSQSTTRSASVGTSVGTFKVGIASDSDITSFAPLVDESRTVVKVSGSPGAAGRLIILVEKSMVEALRGRRETILVLVDGSPTRFGIDDVDRYYIIRVEYSLSTRTIEIHYKSSLSSGYGILLMFLLVGVSCLLVVVAALRSRRPSKAMTFRGTYVNKS